MNFSDARIVRVVVWLGDFVFFFCVAPEIGRTLFPLNTDLPEVIGLVNHYTAVFTTVKVLILNY